jgi:hypothetical protein
MDASQVTTPLNQLADESRLERVYGDDPKFRDVADLLSGV